MNLLTDFLGLFNLGREGGKEGFLQYLDCSRLCNYSLRSSSFKVSSGEAGVSRQSGLGLFALAFNHSIHFKP